jgi:hypothetical protein
MYLSVLYRALLSQHMKRIFRGSSSKESECRTLANLTRLLIAEQHCSRFKTWVMRRSFAVTFDFAPQEPTR